MLSLMEIRKLWSYCSETIDSMLRVPIDMGSQPWSWQPGTERSTLSGFFAATAEQEMEATSGVPWKQLQIFGFCIFFRGS
jgi:hypothetical protein